MIWDTSNSTLQLVYLDHNYKENHVLLNGVSLADAIEMARSVDVTPSGICMHTDHDHKHRSA